MKLLELFAGTRSIAKAFEQRGHETLSVENDRRHKNIDLYEDVLTLTSEKNLSIFGRPDVIWASPPCTIYSIAGISHHRQRDENGNLSPKSDLAKVSDQLILHTSRLIHELKPVYWFIENPCGGLRKMDFMKGLPQYTISYCQYGDNRMKPTDIWTNHPKPCFKPMCHNGDACHERAPRGSKTGTQGLRNAIARSVIPTGCVNILRIYAPFMTRGGENISIAFSVG